MIASAPVIVNCHERLTAMEARIEALGETQATIEERLSSVESLAEQLIEASATRGEHVDVIGDHQAEIWGQIKWLLDAVGELSQLIADLAQHEGSE